MLGLTKFCAIITLFYLTGCMAKQEGPDDGHSHDYDHHGHGHVHTPHMGIIAPLYSGKTQVGFIELKLHDDKGDIELWLTNDEAGTQPFDLLLNTVITVSFPDLDYKSVELRIRNSEENEDEEGISTIRNGKTNYFIFPGDTGADASFFVGSYFVTEVVISFTVEGITYTTAPFTMRPHTH